MARKAFVCGSNGSAAFGTLRYAVSDAAKIAQNLGSIRCGFEVTQPHPEDDKFEVFRRLEETAFSCQEEDTFLCYFSGHGVLDPKGDLHLLWDSRQNELWRAALRVDEVIQRMRACEASNKLLILDCCHAGAATRFKSTGAPVQQVIPSENFAILMASPRLGQVPELDDLQASLFSLRIKEALSERFHEAIQGKDPRLSLQDLVEWLKHETISFNEKSPDSRKVPLPIVLGQHEGTPFFFTHDEAQWKPHNIACPDDTQLVTLPIRQEFYKDFYEGYPNKGYLYFQGFRSPAEEPYPRQYVMCLARDPVTNAQYKAFAQATGRSEPCGKRLDLEAAAQRKAAGLRPKERWIGKFEPWNDPQFNAPDQPVVCVSHEEAKSYCDWVNSLLESEGKQWRTFLPSPTLWDWVAFRGRPIETDNAETWLSVSRERHHNALYPAALDQSGARQNELGISDMIGNVWEWCATSAARYASGMCSIQDAPELRGGGFADNLDPAPGEPIVLPLLDSGRFSPRKNLRHFDLGFRLAAFIFFEDLPEDVASRLSLCNKGSTSFWCACFNQWKCN